MMVKLESLLFMDYYVKKMYYKMVSFIVNSLKVIVLFGGYGEESV